jgi:hypothetical protein
MMREESSRRLLAAAVLAVAGGTAMAVLHYPGGYDWTYTVISRLASRTHNPTGGAWVSGGLLAGMLLLWPVVERSFRGGASALPLAALRLGLGGGVLLGVEGLFVLDYSGVVRKGHELIALLTFTGLYAGVLGGYVQRMRCGAQGGWPALLVVLPLVAIGATQLVLYFDQRELGWVSASWRELGVPFWISFAFWQWAAVGLLGAGLAHLLSRPAAARAGGS